MMLEDAAEVGAVDKFGAEGLCAESDKAEIGWSREEDRLLCRRIVKGLRNRYRFLFKLVSSDMLAKLFPLDYLMLRGLEVG